jgi:hypothetical protein
MQLKDRKALVTGGSRGLGLGVVEALVDAGAEVTVVARGRDDLTAVAERLGVATIAADVADPASAAEILANSRPELLILNAGMPPPMGSVRDISWEDFSATWNSDVKAGLSWVQAALNAPLAPGSRILLGSSGAGINGSPLSGGYAGAKRMLWFLAKYANGVAADLGLDLRFQALLPTQIVGGTGTGDIASAAYAKRLGVSTEQFLARYGEPMPPRAYGDHIVALLTGQQYDDAVAFGVQGDSGITVLEEAA